MSFESWKEELSTICEGFQMDLSCLLDSELDPDAAGRAVVHMEACTACRAFFEDTRAQIRLHKDAADPDRLFACVAMLTAEARWSRRRRGHDLIHRLATIYYQLGKAYVPPRSTRICERV
jgi:anti-sigma factor RsiW